MVPLDVAAPIVRLSDALRRFTYGDWLKRHGHLTLRCDNTDKMAFEEAVVTYDDILALSAAIKGENTTAGQQGAPTE